MGDEVYDVSKYTDEELFGILDVNNPTDRELEAKLLSLVYKYNNIGNESALKLTQFFVDIYNHFFEKEVNAYPLKENVKHQSLRYPLHLTACYYPAAD
jgi:hypothetical protein